MKAELRSVPSDVAHIIEGHVVAAAELLDDDPQLAHRHAQAALRRAARLPVLREVAAETAYAAGEYASALNDYRALRRMTGNDNLIPVMADCERALGRPQNALKLIRQAEDDDRLSSSQRVELVLVKAGAREDMGQVAEAKRLLHAAVTTMQGSDEAKARLHYAYADLLLNTGDKHGAKTFFASSDALDASGLLDAADRLEELETGRKAAPDPDEQSPSDHPSDGSSQSPDVEKPDAEKPDIEKPDIEKPDAEKPDSEKSDDETSSNE